MNSIINQNSGGCLWRSGPFWLSNSFRKLVFLSCSYVGHVWPTCVSYVWRSRGCQKTVLHNRITNDANLHFITFEGHRSLVNLLVGLLVIFTFLYRLVQCFLKVFKRVSCWSHRVSISFSFYVWYFLTCQGWVRTLRPLCTLWLLSETTNQTNNEQNQNLFAEPKLDIRKLWYLRSDLCAMSWTVCRTNQE